jgi:hypothetical protein
MSSTSGPKSKPAYDPARQWGLKPENKTTYVVSGHVVGESTSDASSLYIAESMGREGQAKAKRELAGKDADNALKALLDRDKEGTKAILKAREVAIRDEEGKAVKGVNRSKGQKDAGSKKKSNARGGAKDAESTPPKTSYSADVIQQLGFDPVAMAGHRTANTLTVQKKVSDHYTFLSLRECLLLFSRFSWTHWRQHTWGRRTLSWARDLVNGFDLGFSRHRSWFALIPLLTLALKFQRQSRLAKKFSQRAKG